MLILGIYIKMYYQVHVGEGGGGANLSPYKIRKGRNQCVHRMTAT